MESSAKIGNFFIGGSLEHFFGSKHKSAIWDRTPPNLHTKPSLYVCRRVQGSQTELNYLDSFKSYCNSSDLGFLGSGGGEG